ncbi:hypothetical protein GCM10010275_41490 [Streptomyces litmocidini]|nr:hypothetical protein GCM10010275_41490 [Streptomyces litmocidini]
MCGGAPGAVESGGHQSTVCANTDGAAPGPGPGPSSGACDPAAAWRATGGRPGRLRVGGAAKSCPRALRAALGASQTNFNILTGGWTIARVVSDWRGQSFVVRLGNGDVSIRNLPDALLTFDGNGDFLWCIELTDD